MSNEVTNPNDVITNQSAITITCLALIGAGIMYDWHCYFLGAGLSTIAFFGIILMCCRYEAGKFR